MLLSGPRPTVFYQCSEKIGSKNATKLATYFICPISNNIVLLIGLVLYLGSYSFYAKLPICRYSDYTVVNSGRVVGLLA